jgi:rfaE bifunctional protein kinase chain/domain
MSKNGLVFVSGNFNIVHPGHLRLLKYGKELGNQLIVGVFSDKIAKNAAHVAQNLRLESIESLSIVDKAFIIDKNILDVIKELKPDIVLKGKEHEFELNIEKDIIQSYGGKLVFSSGEIIFSSYDLLNKTLNNNNYIQKYIISKEFLLRHSIKKKKLFDLINNFTNLNVIVLGDLIIDEYITCEPLGMSQEDPTIVVQPLESKKYLGGAGIVALHSSSLGANVNFISVTGDDAINKFAKDKLNEFNVNSHIIIDETRPTTLKQRYRTKGKTLLRVSHLHQTAINVDIQTKIIKRINSLIKNANILIFSDFNYGCLPNEMVNSIIKIANENNVMMIADSQSSSQVGDIARFKGMNLITPTEREARLSVRDNECGLVILAEKLRIISNASNLFLKIGEEGVLIHAETSINNTWLTDRIPALNNNPIDVAGAGDSMMISSAMILASGGNIWEAAAIGSIAAAIQVGRIGNIPITKKEIINNIQ